MVLAPKKNSKSIQLRSLRQRQSVQHQGQRIIGISIINTLPLLRPQQRRLIRDMPITSPRETFIPVTRQHQLAQKRKQLQVNPPFHHPMTTMKTPFMVDRIVAQEKQRRFGSMDIIARMVHTFRVTIVLRPIQEVHQKPKRPVDRPQAAGAVAALITVNPIKKEGQRQFPLKAITEKMEHMYSLIIARRQVGGNKDITWGAEVDFLGNVRRVFLPQKVDCRAK